MLRTAAESEAQRLKYRYLDLRNPAVKQNIILRCQVVSALRAAMTEHGFLEITTPILTASSPEGGGKPRPLRADGPPVTGRSRHPRTGESLPREYVLSHPAL